MSPLLIAALLALAAAGSLVFSTLTYSLRELSRVRLGDYLDRRGLSDWLDRTMNHQLDLVFVTAVWRLLFNVAILLLSLELAAALLHRGPAGDYALAVAIGTLVTLLASVMLPTSIAQHAGDAIVGAVARPLHGLFYAMWPVAKLMHAIDRLVGRAAGASVAPTPDKVNHDIQQEILSAVEEGEKEGAVDEEEREMIESVISFRDTTAGQIMTPRPEVVAIEATETLAEIQAVLEKSGHSRIPVYDDTLDSIVGVLYARDLLKHLGKPPDSFDMRSAVRPAFYAPETRKLRDLLHDFRLQKVHMAVVLDEYGGTAGVVTIEDVLEELVGDISDEHEPAGPTMFKQTDDRTFDVDARMYLDELNRLTGLELPEDAGFDTLGGFVSTTAGRIPAAGEAFEHDGARFTVTAAEPQRVTRVTIELLPAGAAAATGAGGATKVQTPVEEPAAG